MSNGEMLFRVVCFVVAWMAIPAEDATIKDLSCKRFITILSFLLLAFV